MTQAARRRERPEPGGRGSSSPELRATGRRAIDSSWRTLGVCSKHSGRTSVRVLSEGQRSPPAVGCQALRWSRYASGRLQAMSFAAGSSAVPRFDRELGSYGGSAPGPLVIATGAIHGNEPAGVRALVSVLGALRAAAPPFRGRVVGFAGNLEALRQGVRYLDRDLNRAWRPERLAELAGRLP